MKKVSIFLVLLIFVFGCSFSQKQMIKQQPKTVNQYYVNLFSHQQDSIRKADSIAMADSITRSNHKWDIENWNKNLEKGERPNTPPSSSTVEKQVIPIPKSVFPQKTKTTNKVIHNQTKNQTQNKSDELSKTGQITYTLRDTMVVGKTTEINLTISSNVDLKKIISEIETFNKENLNTDTIIISKNMRARLIDPTDVNFKIVGMTEEEQFLNEGEYTLWKWNVTPLNQGNNKLAIAVDIVVNDKSKSIKVYDGEIYVYSDETFLHKVWSFIMEYLEFVVGTILIPIIIFIYTSIKNKKKTD